LTEALMIWICFHQSLDSGWPPSQFHSKVDFAGRGHWKPRQGLWIELYKRKKRQICCLFGFRSVASVLQYTLVFGESPRPSQRMRQVFYSPFQLATSQINWQPDTTYFAQFWMWTQLAAAKDFEQFLADHYADDELFTQFWPSCMLIPFTLLKSGQYSVGRCNLRRKWKLVWRCLTTFLTTCLKIFTMTRPSIFLTSEWNCTVISSG
jgi:hypothetical protein